MRQDKRSLEYRNQSATINISVSTERCTRSELPARTSGTVNRTRRCSGRWLLAAMALLIAWLIPSEIHAETARKITLTFDDLPGLGPVGFWRPREISNMILRTMARYDIKAAGFVVEERIEKDPSTFVILEDWIERDHILGNNTFSHVDLHQLDRRDFIEHVRDGQILLKKLSRLKRFNFKYLRFPYLHQGETLKKKNRIAKSLYQGGYEIAPVSIKMPDNRFNRVYLEVQDDEGPRDRLKKIYLNELKKAVEYSEKAVTGGLRPEYSSHSLAPLCHRNRQLPGRPHRTAAGSGLQLCFIS